MVSLQCNMKKKLKENLPASSDSPTRQGLLAVITSEQILSRSSEVDKHSAPPKKKTD